MSIKVKKTKLNIFSLLMYIEIFSIIYQSGTVPAALQSGTVMFSVTRILMIVIGTFFLLIGFHRGSKKLIGVLALLFVITETLAGINYLLYPNSAIAFQYKIVLFVIFFCSGMFYEKHCRKIEEILYNTIFVISLFTLFMYFVIGILKMSIPYTTIYAPGTSAVYYRNYIDLFYSYSFKPIPRMCGLFWEPGVYQIYLNMGMLLYVLLKKSNKFQLTIFIVSILFTQSTAGYIIMTIIMSKMIVKNKYFSKHYKTIKKLFITVVVVLVVAIVLLIKRDATNQIGDSYYLRVLDIFNAFTLFFQNPVFGTGFYNTESFMALNQFTRGNSNGYLTWLYTTGIVGQFFALFPFFYRIEKCKSKQRKGELKLYFIFVLLINNVEPIYALPVNVWILAREYYHCFALDIN